MSPRSVNGEVPEVEIERFVLMFFHEPEGFIGQTVGDVFAVPTVGDRSDPLLTGVTTAVDAIRRKITPRAGTWFGVEGDFKSMLFRPVLLA